MEILQEITNWSTPNHTYWVERDKLLAYQVAGGTCCITLKTPMRFERTGRKFTVINSTPVENSIQVQGSSGTYSVTLGAKPFCSCTGFKYHGKCKHIQQAISA